MSNYDLFSLLYYNRDWFQCVANFSEVEGHRNLLAVWLSGSGARVVDQLDDHEVLKMLFYLLL